MRQTVVRKGFVQSSFAVRVYHRGNGVFRCRGALGERYCSVDAARFDIVVGVAGNGVCGSCCVLTLLV